MVAVCSAVAEGVMFNQYQRSATASLSYGFNGCLQRRFPSSSLAKMTRRCGMKKTAASARNAAAKWDIRAVSVAGVNMYRVAAPMAAGERSGERCAVSRGRGRTAAAAARELRAWRVFFTAPLANLSCGLIYRTVR